MIKTMLLASAFTLAAPALAQNAVPADTNPQSTQAPTTTPAPADTPMTAPQSSEPAPTPAQPATDSQTAQPAPAPAQAPATSEAQVAAVVDSQFAGYDKDGSGDLNATEFASWMVALRKASEPNFDGDAAESRTWMTRAFAQADVDKSSSVSKTELTTFLTPSAAS